ncbi:hypothetical protein ES703_123257 [subsurface metagenome]
MPEKVSILLIDGTELEGNREFYPWSGVILTKAHRSNKDGTIPIADKVFVPQNAILFIILEGKLTLEERR